MENFTFFVPPYYYQQLGLGLVIGLGLRNLPSMLHPTTIYWYVIDNCTFYDPPYYYLLVRLELGLGLGLRHFTFYDPPYYNRLVGFGLG